MIHELLWYDVLMQKFLALFRSMELLLYLILKFVIDIRQINWIIWSSDHHHRRIILVLKLPELIKLTARIYLTYNLRPATCKYGGFPRREILLNKGTIGWCIKLCRIVELLIIYCCSILNEDKTIGYWSICPKSMSYINCQSEVFVSDKALQVLSK